MRSLDSRSLDLIRSVDYAEVLLSGGLAAVSEMIEILMEENGVEVSEFTLLDSNGKPLPDHIASTIVYEAISFESTAQSTDERFWVSLALGEHRKYSVLRWEHQLNDTSPQSIKKHLDTHFFCTTRRNRFRDHSLSRLWWMRRFIETSEGLDRAKAEELFFGKGFTDFPVQLLGRPNIASLPVATREIVDFAHERFVKGGQKYDRPRVRGMLMNLDILAGHQIPALIDPSEIRSTIEKAYALELDLENIPD